MFCCLLEKSLVFLGVFSLLLKITRDAWVVEPKTVAANRKSLKPRNMCVCVLRVSVSVCNFEPFCCWFSPKNSNDCKI